jgi:cytochrome c oxidase subunit 2
LNPRHIFGTTFATEAIIAGGVFTLIVLTVLVAFGLSRRRKRKDRPANDRPKNTPAELTYAGLVACAVGFIVFLSFRATAQEHDPQRHAPVTVDVQGFQWCWRFSYPGHHRSVTATCRNGDIPTMVVPAGVPVTVRVTGSDVIHSWWVPYLRYKMDAFPNHVNTFTITIPRTGRWRGRCAEFCGENHYSMDFYLQAVSPSRYRHWLAHGSAGPAA